MSHRRRFLQTAAGALAVPWIIPASALSAPGKARSATPAHDACQCIRNGRLGRVHTVT